MLLFPTGSNPLVINGRNCSYFQTIQYYYDRKTQQGNRKQPIQACKPTDNTCHIIKRVQESSETSYRDISVQQNKSNHTNNIDSQLDATITAY